jgi:arsenate reductase
MSIVFYGYPRCGTCRKAQKWLDGRGVTYAARDLVADPIPAETLRDLWRRSGLPLRSFFNTSGESYREGGFKDRLPAMSDDEALAALAADGKLVKRPILDRGDRVLVGFREESYASVF